MSRQKTFYLKELATGEVLDREVVCPLDRAVRNAQRVDGWGHSHDEHLRMVAALGDGDCTPTQHEDHSDVGDVLPRLLFILDLDDCLSGDQEILEICALVMHVNVAPTSGLGEPRNIFRD